MHTKRSSAKWRPFRLDLSVLIMMLSLPKAIRTIYHQPYQPTWHRKPILLLQFYLKLIWALPFISGSQSNYRKVNCVTIVKYSCRNYFGKKNIRRWTHPKLRLIKYECDQTWNDDVIGWVHWPGFSTQNKSFDGFAVLILTMINFWRNSRLFSLDEKLSSTHRSNVTLRVMRHLC